MQADASGLLASQLDKEMLAWHTRIQFHNWSLDCAPSNTTYNMLMHGFKTDGSGLLTSWLDKETLVRHMCIQFHDRSLDRAPSDTTYDMLVHGVKTVQVTGLNRKAPMNLLP